MADAKIYFLQSVPLFDGLCTEHLDSLARLLVERSFGRGDVVFFEDDPGDALYIVQSGRVKIYRVAEDGREKTLALFGEGDFFGEMALVDGGPRSAIAEAVVKTTIYALHRVEFQELVTANPAISLGMIKVLSSRLRQTNSQVMDAVFRDVRGRVVQTLLELSIRHGVEFNGESMIDMKLTHQELANMVGTARETVSRILAELQDAGLVRFEGRNMVLVDASRLAGYGSGEYYNGS